MTIDPGLELMIREASCRASDPSDWPEVERQREIEEGWIVAWPTLEPMVRVEVQGREEGELSAGK